MKTEIRLPLQEAKARARVLKALAHPLRLQIIQALQNGESCLCELEPFFKLNRSNLSRHLAILKQVGIVSERRAGPRVMLKLATPCILRAFDCAMEVVRADHESRNRALAPRAA